MKKLISLILVLALGLTVFPAFAEETETETVTPDTVEWGTLAAELEAAGVQGTYYTLDGVKAAFWVPAYLKPADVDATYGETDTLAAFSTESGEKGFVISLFELQVESMDQLAAAVEKIGGQDGRHLLINGLDAYSYVYDNMLYVSFFAGEGHIISFDFYPASDYVFSAMAKIIAASVQPYDPQQEE